MSKKLKSSVPKFWVLVVNVAFIGNCLQAFQLWHSESQFIHLNVTFVDKFVNKFLFCKPKYSSESVLEGRWQNGFKLDKRTEAFVGIVIQNRQKSSPFSIPCVFFK